jgi:hypothetical protein
VRNPESSKSGFVSDEILDSQDQQIISSIAISEIVVIFLSEVFATTIQKAIDTLIFQQLGQEITVCKTYEAASCPSLKRSTLKIATQNFL